jgi:hypothetical protein
MPTNTTLETTSVQTLAITQNVLQQVGTQLRSSPMVTEKTENDFVENIKILSYIPSKTIKFEAHGMKPNTRVWAYFDNVPVTNWCSPVLDGWSQDNINASQQTVAYGTTELMTDSTGYIQGLFAIPPKQFQSQQIIFKLVDISDLTQGEAAITTEADGTYFGSTLSYAKGHTTFTTQSTTISKTEVKQDLSVGALSLLGDASSKYIPDPVYTPQAGGSGCGCGCFIGSSLITLASGEEIPINQVKIGDKIYNYNKTQINTVKFVESLNDKYFDNLYSPSKDIEPFATNNHPIYIDGELSCIDPERNNNWYPWLGKNKKIEAIIGPIKNDKVYNLWVDGDGTYIVNGYGTTSIFGDGGLLRLLIEQNLISEKRAIEILYNYLLLDKYTIYGIYIFNIFFGKLNIKFINKTFAKIFETDTYVKKMFDPICKIVGGTYCLVK